MDAGNFANAGFTQANRHHLNEVTTCKRAQARANPSLVCNTAQSLTRFREKIG